MERMSVTGRRGDAVFALCVESGEYPESLQPQKFYRVLPDRNAERYDEIRVVDDSGEDYLYPAEYFLPIEPPKPREVASPRAFLANLDVIRGRRLTA